MIADLKCSSNEKALLFWTRQWIKSLWLGHIIYRREDEMSNNEMSKQKKGLYTLAMVNVGIWAISLIALVVLLQGKGNLKGMFVVLTGGTAVGIQMIALVSKLK